MDHSNLATAAGNNDVPTNAVYGAWIGGGKIGSLFYQDTPNVDTSGLGLMTFAPTERWFCVSWDFNGVDNQIRVFFDNQLIPMSEPRRVPPADQRDAAHRRPVRHRRSLVRLCGLVSYHRSRVTSEGVNASSQVAFQSEGGVLRSCSMLSRLSSLPLAALVLCPLLGCEGEITSPAGGGCATPAPVVRRLTAVQLDATLSAAFGTPISISTSLPADDLEQGYSDHTSLVVSTLFADQLDSATSTLMAAQAASPPPALTCNTGEATPDRVSAGCSRTSRRMRGAAP